MENAKLPAIATTSQSGIHRLILAASAAGALATLCWAALQVRTARAEIRQLEERLAAQAVRQPVPAPLSDADKDDLARRLAAAESLHKQASDQSAARIAELENVISFLRQENTAAQQTIERLRTPPPEPDPPAKAEPVKTKPGRGPARKGNPERD